LKALVQTFCQRKVAENISTQKLYDKDLGNFNYFVFLNTDTENLLLPQKGYFNLKYLVDEKKLKEKNTKKLKKNKTDEREKKVENSLTIDNKKEIDFQKTTKVVDSEITQNNITKVNKNKTDSDFKLSTKKTGKRRKR